MYANKSHKQAGRQAENERKRADYWNEDLKQHKKELNDDNGMSRAKSTALRRSRHGGQ